MPAVENWGEVKQSVEVATEMSDGVLHELAECKVVRYDGGSGVVAEPEGGVWGRRGGVFQ